MKGKLTDEEREELHRIAEVRASTSLPPPGVHGFDVRRFERSQRKQATRRHIAELEQKLVDAATAKKALGSLVERTREDLTRELNAAKTWRSALAVLWRHVWRRVWPWAK